MPGLNRGPPTTIRFYVESRQPDGLAIKGLGHFTTHNYCLRIINHRCAHIIVSEKLLYRSDIISVLQQVRCKGMA
jgi:hypothetical protein